MNNSIRLQAGYIYKIILLTFFILLSSCNDDIITPVLDYKEIKNATITANGGSISTNDIIIEIPAGSFISTVELKLLESSSIKPDGENTIGKVFKLTGLPENFVKPIRIAFKYTQSGEGKSLLSIGEYVKKPSVLDSTLCFNFIDTKDSSGFLISEIFPFTQNKFNKDNNDKILRNKDQDIYISASKKKEVVTNKYFKIYFNPNNISESQAENVNTLFESIYNFYSGTMGFDMQKYKNWPLDIHIKKLSSNIGSDEAHLGEYSSIGYITKPYFNINEDLAKSGNIAENKITFGHEFFHFLQDIQYSLSLSGDNIWFDDASASYIEKYFSNDPLNPKVPLNTNSYASSVFYGLRHGSSKIDVSDISYGWKDYTARNRHGYAMSFLLEFLSNKYGDKSGSDYRIKKIMNNISAHSNPLDIISDEFGTPDNWLEEFYKSLYDSKIYNTIVEPPITKSFTISGLKDTLIKTTERVSDLLCNYFDISLKNISPKAHIKIVVNSLDNFKSTLIVYSKLGNGRHYFGEAKKGDTLIINDLTKFVASHSGLGKISILVVNHAHDPVIFQDEKIELSIKVEDQKESILEQIKKCKGGQFSFRTRDSKWSDGDNDDVSNGISFNELVGDVKWNDNKMTLVYEQTIPYQKTNSVILSFKPDGTIINGEIFQNSDNAFITSFKFQDVPYGGFGYKNAQDCHFWEGNFNNYNCVVTATSYGVTLESYSLEKSNFSIYFVP